MTKVSDLRLIILLCGITLAIGETIKIKDSSNTTTANNKSTEKGLFFTICLLKDYSFIFIFVTCLT